MKKFVISLLSLTIIFFIAGCEKFLDINKSPNSLSEAPVDLVLPATMVVPQHALHGFGEMYGEYWAQHWTQGTGGVQFRGTDRWEIDGSDFDGSGYQSIYYTGLNDLKYIKEWAAKEQNWTYYLIATSLEAYYFQMLVDLWDEIPFIEALRGDEGFIAPKFDKGTLIYDSLVARLDFALSKNLGNVVYDELQTADLLFGGDKNKWRQFANTMKLKLYLRQINVRQNVAIDGLKNMKDADFLGVDASFAVYSDQSNKRNPIYSLGAVQFTSNLTMSRTLLSYLIDDFDAVHKVRDPRVAKLCNLPSQNLPGVSNGNYTVLYQGDYFNASYTNNSAYLASPILRFNDPVYYFTASEVNFMLAEAYLTEAWYDIALAQKHYEDGVIAAFVRLGLTQNDAAAVIGDAGYAKWSLAQNDKERRKLIWMQKWVAMANIQGLEAFLEHNRTDIPEELSMLPTSEEFKLLTYEQQRGRFTPAILNITTNRYPRRFMCPNSESTRANTPEAYKAKKIYDKVWWDVTPIY